MSSGMVLVDSAQEKQFQRFPEEIVAATNKGLRSPAASATRRHGSSCSKSLPGSTRGLTTHSRSRSYRALVLANPNHLATLRGEIEALERGDTEPVTNLG